MNHLKPLVMMQLKDKIDFSFLKSKKKTITKTVFSIAGFCAVVAVCYLLFVVASMLNLFSLIPSIPVSVMVVIFSVMFILSCFSCTFGLMKTMYFAIDNQVLLTLPVKPNQVFLSKLIVFYIYELIKNLYFLIPVFIAYGIFSGFSILYYPWLLIAMFLISMLPVLIGAVLSIPLMFITTYLKQVPWLRLLLFLGAIAGVFVLVIKGIALIPENIDIIGSWGKTYWQIQNFLAGFSTYMYPLTWLTKMLCGSIVNLKHVLFSLDTLIVFACLLGSVIVLFSISFVASRPLFFKMASKPFEYKKKIIRGQYKNKKRSIFASSLDTSIKMSFRTPEYLYNYIGILFVMPIAIFLLNKIFSAMNTKLLGSMMILSFNLLMILLILLASNVMIASIYSQEGRASYYFKTMPTMYKKYLFPKLIFSICITAISTLITVCIFGQFASLGVWGTILCYIGIMGIYVAHLFWSAELDIMNPQNEQYATTGSEVSNPNERKSTIFGFIIAVLIFVISLKLFTEGVLSAWVKIAFIGIIFAITRIYLYFTKVKIYFKEK